MKSSTQQRKMQKNFSGCKNAPKKRFGQNFLIDAEVIKNILDSAGIENEDTVLEIGPGKGALTKKLSQKAKRLVCIEIDRDLVAHLKEEFSNCSNVDIIEKDVLKVDLYELFGKEAGGIKVVANLPYYITTPIIMKLLECKIYFEQITVMVQREVAKRMCARPNSSDYGALSLAIAFYAEPEIVCSVPPSSFFPSPKVDSCVVKMLSKKPICSDVERIYLFKYIKAAFSQRRKTFINAISSAKLATKEDIRIALTKLGYSEKIRGEELSLEEYLTIAREIGEKNGY